MRDEISSDEPRDLTSTEAPEDAPEDIVEDFDLDDISIIESKVFG